MKKNITFIIWSAFELIIIGSVFGLLILTFYNAGHVINFIKSCNPLTLILFITAIFAVIVSFTCFIFQAAKQDTWATTVPQEEFKFVAKGESLSKIIHNLVGAGLDKDGNVTSDPKKMVKIYYNPIFQLLQKTLGIYWVSILFPARRVFSFKIDKYKLIQESELPEKHSIKDLVEIEKGVTINSLRRFFPRPLFIPAVELQDGIFVDIVVMSEYEAINPYKAVFKYKGKFFPLLDAPTEGAVNDFGSTIKYQDLLKTKRGKGSDFSEKIIGMIGSKVEETTGIRQNACYIVQFGIPMGEPEVVAASQAKEVKRLEGEGVKSMADAKAYEITTLATAQARSFAAPVEAMVALKVDPNIAAEQVGRKLSLEEVAGANSKIVTFVEGGSSTKTGININTP
jgi:hypothetical protein